MKDLLTSKKQNKTRQLDDNMYVIDVGYRNKEPIALVERTTKYGKEYIIGFNYEIKDNKIQWGYGYYYDADITKAKNDFKKVLAGGNLADTFKENKEKESVMENDSNELQFYNETEIRDIIKNNENLYFADSGIDEVIVKFDDIPDFIVDINRKQGLVDLKFYKMENDVYEPDITTMGEFLDKVKPEIREKIIDRLVKLQMGEIEPKEYKLIDENEFEDIKIKMEQEVSQEKDKENNIIVTIEDIEESLCDLDTEYREALAIGLTKLNYISDTPIQLKYGNEEQQKELERVWKKPLKAKQVNEIIQCIADKMKGDFQYGQFRGIASEYMDISKAMKKNEEKQKRKNQER